MALIVVLQRALLVIMATIALQSVIVRMVPPVTTPLEFAHVPVALKAPTAHRVGKETPQVMQKQLPCGSFFALTTNANWCLLLLLICLSKTDINECSSHSHNCHGNGRCFNTFGSYSCTCKAGYEGNGLYCQGNT